jgi:hypothetical protein
MATSEWIESAARTPKPPNGDGFTDRKAESILAGAETPLPAWQTETAARYLARESPDLAAWLGLTLPEVFTPADAVVAASVARGADGVRVWAAGTDRDRLTAARQGLAARRARRERR